MTEQTQADSDAANTFYQDFREELLKFANRLILRFPIISRYGVEDIVQDTIEKALTHSRTFATPQDKINYFKTALLNNVRNLFHKKYFKHTQLSLNTEFVIDEKHDRNNVFKEFTTMDLKNTLMVRVRELEQLIARIRPQSQSGRVNYFAVYLFHLRLTIAKRLVNSSVAPSKLKKSLSEIVETLVPWHAEDNALRFLPEFPPIYEIWDQMRTEIDNPGRDITVQTVIRAVHVLNHDKTEGILTPSRWYAWVKRSRFKMMEAAGESEWKRVMQPWFIPSGTVMQQPGRKA